MTELIFVIEEDPTGGFTASAAGAGIFTQGDTRVELEASIREAVRCHFPRPEDAPKLIQLHFVRDEVLAP